jgi:hypothetical protein
MIKRLLLIIGILLALVGLAIPVIAQACGTSITVQSGDTLWDIARRCSLTVPAILDLNPEIVEPSVINVGTIITIPASNAARPAQVNVYPQSVRPGASIQVIGNGFPLTTDVTVSAGRQGQDFALSQTVETDRQGAFLTSMVIPPSAALNERWIVVVQTIEGQIYRAQSFAFFIDDETVRPPVPQPTTPPGNSFTQTQIYLIAIGCGDSTVPYTVSIQSTVAPLTAALNQLFTIGSQPFGYYNALGSSNLRVQGIDIDDGVATIDLTGTLSLGGVCDAPRVEAQLRQTALQYATIDAVNIYINGQPLANLLSGQ